jgi:hypothetical protein
MKGACLLLPATTSIMFASALGATYALGSMMIFSKTFVIFQGYSHTGQIELLRNSLDFKVYVNALALFLLLSETIRMIAVLRKPSYFPIWQILL